MRSRFAAMLVLGACSVPDKLPSEVDAGPGVDAAVADVVAPETSITGAPDEFSAEGNATFTFTADETPVTFACSVDDDTPVTCASPYTRALGDGPHRFSVRATDAAGNADDTPAEHLWSIDRIPPDTTITAHPPAADNSVIVQFSFEGNEDNLSFDCSTDAASFAPCTSGDSIGPIAEGPHSFAVRARDRAGNEDTSPAIFAWTIDTSTPDTQLLTGPADSSGTPSATFTFVSPDAGPGATFTCQLDGTGFHPCTSPRSYFGLAEGPHAFAVRVQDAVGNQDPTPATRAWTVDLTPPETSIVTGPSGLVAFASATFTFSSNESPATFECRLDGTAYVPCSSPDNLPGVAQGAHTFSARARDAAGHADSTPASRTWTVDTVAPDVQITAGPAAGSTSGPRVTFGFTVSDGAVACLVDAGAFAPCASPISFSLPAGSHQLQIRATDAAGNVTIATRSWTVACAAPDPTGAAGLLHLDETAGQVLANAVTGGATATLGEDTTAEVVDPDLTPAGRFAGAVSFAASDLDRVEWPVALPASAELTMELWARPDPTTGVHYVARSQDARVTLRVIASGATKVRFSITVVQADGMSRVATSAPVTAGAWHHVLASVAEPTLRLWVDGVRTETAGVVLGAPPALASLRLGSGTATNGFDGTLDELWLGQTAITTDAAALDRYCPP